ncbi:hypothetical protein DAMNIGENAA_33350 [Desulforhabdus amnigena]|uniref:Uncharacterized protein n=1 Tax=Desulforhabdus amnigena TaxID=40218 RepID=A0A9W6FW24_9BACT|nr:hypothetical protein DAMNIGENAA_33350 [Desulforhabdus amnigena]
MLKFCTGDIGGHYTLLLIGITFLILGVQWFSVGLLSELINYFTIDQSGDTRNLYNRLNGPLT